MNGMIELLQDVLLFAPLEDKCEDWGIVVYFFVSLVCEQFIECDLRSPLGSQ